MNVVTKGAILSFLGLSLGVAAAPPSDQPTLPIQGSTPANHEPTAVELAALADKRYQEMLSKMRDAVEEIAQLYGNPVFLQVFTNDEGRAAELKLRLHAEHTVEEVRREVSDLEKRREDLLGDIALKNKEASRLSERLARQRAALEALASAIEQARNAVEATSK